MPKYEQMWLACLKIGPLVLVILLSCESEVPWYEGRAQTQRKLQEMMPGRL